MKSLSGVLLPREAVRRTRSVDVASAVLPFIIGLVLALLTLKVGPLAVPIVVFLFLILPWLVQDPFRLFIWLIVTWPVLTLYARIPLPVGIPDISYDRVLVVLTLAIILLEGLMFKRKLLKAGVLDILAAIYIAAQFRSRAFVLWFGGMGTPDLNGLLDIALVPVAMYWMTKNLLVSRWHLKWLLYALILAIVIICVSGLYEQAVGTEKRLFAVPLELGGSTEAQRRGWMDVPGGRAAGVMGNPAIYGAVLGMGVLASLCCVVHAERKRTQAALVATVVVLLYGVFASYTRSAWISTAVALFITQFFVKDLWKKTLSIFLVGVLLLFLAWGSLADSPTVRDRILGKANVVGRLHRASFAWDRFLERPLLGWGSGALNVLTSKQFPGEGFSTSHNTYLTFLVDGGLVLFLSFSALSIYLLIRAIHVYGLTQKNSFERSVLAAMTGCILIFLLSGLSLELRYFGYFNALFWICAGVIDRLGAAYGSEGGTSSLVTQSSNQVLSSSATTPV